MKFELRIACSYLMPTRLNWSRSLMSLLSIFVVSSVVWLAMVFLSISAGLQQLWIKKLIAIDAPIRIRPTDHYFNSYFYNIDFLSQKSDYQHKSLIEKARLPNCDLYDSALDGPLPDDFPPPDLDRRGNLKNPVKALFASLNQVPNIEFADGSTAYANTVIDVQELSKNETALQRRSYHQMSLIAPIIWRSELVEQLQNQSKEDWPAFFDRWFDLIEPQSDANQGVIWRHLKIAAAHTTPEGLILSPHGLPRQGTFEAIASDDLLHLCQTKGELDQLKERLGGNAHRVKGHLHNMQIAIDGSEKTNWSLIYHGPLIVATPPSPSGTESHWRQIPVTFTSNIQGLVTTFHGLLGQVVIEDVQAQNKESWASAIAAALRENNSAKAALSKSAAQQRVFGALFSANYRRNGVCVGDLGTLQRSVITPAGVQMEELCIMVCGFFDAAMMPNGTKTILAEPLCCQLLHGDLPESEQRHHSAVSVFCALKKAPQVALQIKEQLKKLGVGNYWSVQCFEEFEHIRDLLNQLKSDQLLLGVLAVIIIAVACSNIISMLLLLVVEKKCEIAIFRALGASSKAIAIIFSLCGFLTGLISGILGTCLAWLTLSHIDTLTKFLSYLWGRELFHPLYYGDNLPDQMTPSAIVFTLITTATFSALAALVPARSAARLDPSKLLRDL